MPAGCLPVNFIFENFAIWMANICTEKIQSYVTAGKIMEPNLRLESLLKNNCMGLFPSLFQNKVMKQRVADQWIPSSTTGRWNNVKHQCYAEVYTHVHVCAHACSCMILPLYIAIQNSKIRIQNSCISLYIFFLPIKRLVTKEES